MRKVTAFAFLLISLALLNGAPASAQALPWWNNRVFYEVFVRSFYDSNGDGIGDLPGLIAKLDYLNDGDPATTTDLGVTGLWLMPIMASPSYHGYDVTDYDHVNPDYGTNDDFKALVAAAHARGIAVIVDLPVNHTSSAHPWFRASAAGDPQYRDWYIWDDSCPSYRGPWNEKVWIPLQGSCYYAVFWDGMPDLNYRNPAVVAAMNDVARFWLEDMGADGFRLDGLKHIVEDGTNQINTPETHAWAASFRSYVHTLKPDALLVGEVNDNTFVSSSYVPDSADLTFDFDLAEALLTSAKSGAAAGVATLQQRVERLYPPGQYAAFLTNHDQNRAANQLSGDDAREEAAADLLMTQPGVPFVYYGEEIGMSGAKPDERIRTPMQWDATNRTAGFTTGTPWEPLQSNYAAVNVAGQTDDPALLLSHYRSLIRLRSAHPALQTGTYTPVESGARAVYSFLRENEQETLLVLVNLSGAAVSDYQLTLDEHFADARANLAAWTLADGSLALTPTAAATPAPALAQPTAGSYVPLAELPSHSLTVIQFSR